MLTEDRRSIVERAKHMYEPMREMLEADHPGRYIAIEPESGDTFIAETFDSAVKAAIISHPDRVTHTLRIGYQTAFHIGLMEQ